MTYWNVYKNNCTGDFVYGDELTPMAPSWTFITKYKKEKEAKEICEKLNGSAYAVKTKKNLTEKIAEQLIPKSNEFLNQLEENCTETFSRVKDPNIFDWKEAMKALIEGKRIEAYHINNETGATTVWFEVEFAIGPEDKKLGESVEFGKDWKYRILDDSKEREELFDECEKLGIINVSRVSKISTPLLHDIVDAVKSVDLDWDEIAKQINEETK